jgi:hypothetical protein
MYKCETGAIAIDSFEGRDIIDFVLTKKKETMTIDNSVISSKFSLNLEKMLRMNFGVCLERHISWDRKRTLEWCYDSHANTN